MKVINTTWYGKRYEHSLVSRGITVMLKSKGYFDDSVNHFGVTNNPQESGFILPNGAMLDFSSGVPNQKWLDHIEIKKSGYESANQFVKNGAIRISMTHSGESLLLQIHQPLTDSQKRTIGKIIREYMPRVEIDVTGEPYYEPELKGYFVPTIAKSFERGSLPGKIFSEIDKMVGD